MNVIVDGIEDAAEEEQQNRDADVPILLPEREQSNYCNRQADVGELARQVGEEILQLPSRCLWRRKNPDTILLAAQVPEEALE